MVDTPGFGADLSDREILDMVAKWMKEKCVVGLVSFPNANILVTRYPRSMRLVRVVYLHKITETRLVLSPLKILHSFAIAVKGQGGNVASVVVATTMWSPRINSEQAEHRHEVLGEETQRKLADEYKVMRFDNDRKSAWDIADNVVAQTSAGIQGLLEEAIPAPSKDKVIEDGSSRYVFIVCYPSIKSHTLCLKG